MKEYIERDMVLSHKWEVRSYDPSDPDPVTEVVSVSSIMRIPAADVVPVVRCCECIYHDDESQYHYCRKWRRNCPNDSDFFCKWGKRKNGGQDDANN